MDDEAKTVFGALLIFIMGVVAVASSMAAGCAFGAGVGWLVLALWGLAGATLIVAAARKAGKDE